MPSKDPINPEANRWLYRDAQGRLHETRAAEPGATASRTAQAAHVQALAARLSVPAEQLAEHIPEDTLRRLKYPVIEQTDPDNGLATFKHDPGIIQDGRIGLLKTDRAHEAIEAGAHGRGAGAPQPRGDDGRFSK
jgi:hypothetical protein